MDILKFVEHSLPILNITERYSSYFKLIVTIMNCIQIVFFIYDFYIFYF